MGKVTGFMEFQRVEEGYAPVAERLKDYREFVIGLNNAQARQQGARCMDCGTPFCNSGCPVNNIIPDFNDLVYRQDWKSAIEVLHSTNNFPEFTGRICPAPCEAACVLNVNDDAVGIKSIEHAIIDRAWAEGWVQPRPAKHKTGKKVAVVGAGPAGMAAAQQLARAGHDVTVFEKNDRVGGLLRYGIPDFKMEKSHIDRRVEQMKAEGVVFRTGVVVGAAKDPLGKGSKVTNLAKETVTPEELQKEFDAVLLTGGAEQSRDLPVPGRDQHVAQRKVLRHAHDGVVHRAVAVRVVLTDYVAHDTGRFLVRAVPVVVELVHREKHAPVHRLETIPRVGQGAPHDHAHGVIQVASPHLLFQTDRQGLFGELGHGHSHRGEEKGNRAF